MVAVLAPVATAAAATTAAVAVGVSANKANVVHSIVAAPHARDRLGTYLVRCDAE